MDELVVDYCMQLAKRPFITTNEAAGNNGPVFSIEFIDSIRTDEIMFRSNLNITFMTNYRRLTFITETFPLGNIGFQILS